MKEEGGEEGNKEEIINKYILRRTMKEEKRIKANMHEE